MKNQIKLFCGALTLALAGQSEAATTWILGPTPDSGVSVTGYSNTGGSGAESSQTIQAQSKQWYPGGWGIHNADGCSGCGDAGDVVNAAPEHAIDNNDRHDMALLSFGSNVKLTQMKIGWGGSDTDMTVMAYTGASPFVLNTNLVGRTYAQLMTSGWSAIGHYANVVSGSQKTINAADVFSSYWLIGAYNPLANPGGGLSDGNDYIKLMSVTGSLPSTPQISVPEPGSFALIGLALVTMITLRKRGQT